MPNTLHEIVENKKREIAARAADAREGSSPLAEPQPARGTFLPSLRRSGTRLIAEIKPKSPSAGQLAESVDIEAITRVYSRYAAAISVLTDEKYFGGSLEALHRVSSLSHLPTLCKDFILDESQVDEARRAGAEAVLLIVKILNDEQLARLHARITALNMVPVVEVQNESEIERAKGLPLQCVLINNRNLETFETDLATTEQLAHQLPSEVVLISASGIETRADITRLTKYTNAFLVGSSLMRSANVDEKLRHLFGAPRLVKVCGITSLTDAKLAIESGADLLGLIFVKESPRSISVEAAKQICSELGGERFVGVFRDQSVEDMKRIQREVGFAYVQLHGNEAPNVVSQLPLTIKAVTVTSEADVLAASQYQTASFLLFDLSKQQSNRVSSSQLIKWINEVNPPIPFFLAGGLDAESVADAAAAVTATNFVGVDVASGVESSPGAKCTEKLNSFIKEAKYNAVTR
jgi:indole-3-glycerol phosphate synthase/phosphoribosylanthranilate isomerase